jgi:hypothetical protein
MLYPRALSTHPADAARPCGKNEWVTSHSLRIG